MLITGLDPADDSCLFHDEVFADLLCVVRLPGSTVDAHLAEATRFANDRLAGTLAATLLVDPVTATDHASALDRAVADLHYGAIGINEWAVMSLDVGYGTWGGSPATRRKRSAVGSARWPTPSNCANRRRPSSPTPAGPGSSP